MIKNIIFKFIVFEFKLGAYKDIIKESDNCFTIKPDKYFDYIRLCLNKGYFLHHRYARAIPNDWDSSICFKIPECEGCKDG